MKERSRMRALVAMTVLGTIEIAGCGKGSLAPDGLAKGEDTVKVKIPDHPISGPFQMSLSAAYLAGERQMIYRGDLHFGGESYSRADVTLTADDNAIPTNPYGSYELTVSNIAPASFPLKTSFVASGLGASDVALTAEIVPVSLQDQPAWTAEGNLAFHWHGDALTEHDTISVTIRDASGKFVIGYTDGDNIVEGHTVTITRQFAALMSKGDYTTQLSRQRTAATAETWPGNPDSPMGRLTAEYVSEPATLHIPAR